MQRYISLYDLIEVKQIKECIVEDDQETFLKHLHYLGFDISKEIKEESHLHRPLFGKDNEVRFGVMYIGAERQDSGWMKSSASIENIMDQYVKTDPDMFHMLKDLNSLPNFTGMAIKHAFGEEEAFPKEYKEQ